MAYFTLFEYVYHNVADVFYLIIGWLVVRLVGQSPWRQHLKWVVPQAIANTCFGCVRVTYDLHHFGHLGTRMQIYTIGQAFWYIGSIIGIYGTWMFWRTIKDSVRQGSLQSAAGKDLFTQQFGEAEPGVWPPPPRIQP